MPRLVFGQEDRDQLTLRRVTELDLTLVFECAACQRVSQQNAMDLAERYGIGARLGS